MTCTLALCLYIYLSYISCKCKVLAKHDSQILWCKQNHETKHMKQVLRVPCYRSQVWFQMSMWIGFMSSQIIQAHTRVNPNTIPICFKQFVPCHPCQESQVQVFAQCSCIVGFDWSVIIPVNTVYLRIVQCTLAMRTEQLWTFNIIT